MNFRAFRLERLVLILLVLAVSMIIGWYGERAVEKFFINNQNSETPVL